MFDVNAAENAAAADRYAGAAAADATWSARRRRRPSQVFTPPPTRTPSAWEATVTFLRPAQRVKFFVKMLQHVIGKGPGQFVLIFLEKNEGAVARKSV